MASLHGIPLLSGPPPTLDSDACRKCNKEFNILFTRSRRCNHCGCSYCHSCSDYQALMPRSGTDSGYDPVHVCAYCIELLNITAAGPGQLRGMPLSKLKTYANSYDINISRAVEKGDIVEAILRARGTNGCLPQSKEDYYRKNKVPNPYAGSRPRGFFSRSNATNPPPVPPRPQPHLQGHSVPGVYSSHATMDDIPSSLPRFPQQPQPQPQYGYPPLFGNPPEPQQPYTHYTPPYQPYSPNYHSQQHYNTPPYHQSSQRPQPPPPPPPQETRPPPPPRPTASSTHQTPLRSQPQPNPQTPSSRQRTTSASAQSQPSPPPAVPMPTLDQLLVMTQASIAALPVGVLKNILFTNHVNASNILEKSELVKKVVTLIEDEKKERERQRLAEEAERLEEEERRREREEAIRREQEEKRRKEEEERLKKERQRRQRQRARVEDVDDDIDEMMDVEISTLVDDDEHMDDWQREPSEQHQPSTSSTPPKTSSPPQKPLGLSALERSGLCVICQDEEANIAIVDCGHMVMCRACSDLIMKSSKECPLCRARIVTEARLLRIFKS